MKLPDSTNEQQSSETFLRQGWFVFFLIFLTLLAHGRMVFRQFVWDDVLYVQALRGQGAFAPF